VQGAWGINAVREAALGKGSGEVTLRGSLPCNPFRAKEHSAVTTGLNSLAETALESLSSYWMRTWRTANVKEFGFSSGAVITATGHELGAPGGRVRVAEDLFSSPRHPDRLWGPPSLSIG
jgi:hypothetical protein